MRAPATLPAGRYLPATARAAQNKNRHNGEDHAAEDARKVERVHKRDQSAVGQRERRQRHDRQHAEAFKRLRVVTETEFVEDIGQETAAKPPLRSEHRA